MGRQITNKDVETVRELYIDHTVADIAKKIGRTRQAVYEIARRFNIKKYRLGDEVEITR